MVGNIKLTKNYKGYNAFPKFLRDFKGGKHTFSHREFPEYDSDLLQLGIRFIDVEYRFTGHGAVLDLLNVPSSVPKDIVWCWEY
jgi:type VI secretion system protein ImpL